MTSVFVYCKLSIQTRRFGHNWSAAAVGDSPRQRATTKSEHSEKVHLVVISGAVHVLSAAVHRFFSKLFLDGNNL